LSQFLSVVVLLNDVFFCFGCNFHLLSLQSYFSITSSMSLVSKLFPPGELFWFFSITLPFLRICRNLFL
jgi:hypothetical protein